MDVFEISDLLSRREESGQLYLEFFQAPTMSVGVYELAAGSVDPQQPHTEDEVYYVVGGTGQVQIDGEDTEISPGSVVFVAAGVEHRFHSITEDLKLLVVFAPPRGSGRIEFGHGFGQYTLSLILVPEGASDP